jgi:hypothetical protein
MHVNMHVMELCNNIAQQLSSLSFKSHINGISKRELTTSIHVLNDSIICSLSFIKSIL